MASIEDNELPFNIVQAGTAIATFMDQICGKCYELREECECAAVEVVPKYQHDSECDAFLGTETIDEVVYDLYSCYDSDTLIARYSDEGHDYLSGRMFVGKVPALTRAYQKAVELGYRTV